MSNKKTCSLCERNAWARGYCYAHYRKWRFENVPGAREKTLKVDRERAKRAADNDPEKLKKRWKSQWEKKVSQISDSYIKKLMKGHNKFAGTVDADQETIDLYRTLLLLKRMKNELKRTS